MIVSDSKNEHTVYVFLFLFFLVACVIFAGLFTSDHDLLYVVMAWIGGICAIITGLAVTRDYWIDQSGVYVRIFYGKIVRRKILYADIKFFGVLKVVSGYGAARKIVLSAYAPKRSHDNGYSIRVKDTVAFDYSPELFAQIQAHFQPPMSAMIMMPTN